MKRHKWPKGFVKVKDKVKCLNCNVWKSSRLQDAGYLYEVYSFDQETWYKTRPNCGEESMPEGAVPDDVQKERRQYTIYDVKAKGQNLTGYDEYVTVGVAFGEQGKNKDGLKVNVQTTPIGGWNGELWLFPRKKKDE
jgi:hypothetical protein